MKISGAPADKFIAPLLLIPLIENSFKHGTSQVLDKPWIRLSMDITDNGLRFLLSNSKPSTNKSIEGKKGIGLKNVSKRMQLLYPNKHELSIKVTDDVYEVEVLVPLQVDKQQDADLKPDQFTPPLITTYDKW
jgi:LytS/YehU family sensor histidine kinase